jgi:uncharacterized protein (DUF1810 family)
MMTRLESAAVNVARHREQALKSLRKRAEYLHDRMARLMGECDKALAGESYAINSLGEVGSAGLDIDLACGRVRHVEETVNLLKWLTAAD